jgi:hypothetical protein
MNVKTFRKFLDRDGGCVHCGETEAVSPHHRLNRGMGGSKARDVPSNIIIVCSWLNNAMESDARHATQAKELGWKLQAGSHPDIVPIYEAASGNWYLLDNQFGRTQLTTLDKPKLGGYK